MKIGYARVSTTNQDLSLQLSSLNKIGCDKIFCEKKSAFKERSEFDKMMSMVRTGDIIVVWKLDRLARSMKQLLAILETFNKLDIDLICIDGKIDTTSAQGRLMYTITAAFAQFERDLIVERTKAGLEEARKRGVQLGRKKGLSEEGVNKMKIAIELYSRMNYKSAEICSLLKISKATLYRYLKTGNVNLKNNFGRPGKALIN